MIAPANLHVQTAGIQTSADDVESPVPSHQRGGDHAISHNRGSHRHQYPKDCPPSNVRWFFAVDLPKRKPNASATTTRKTTSGPPKKYSAFSVKDSKSIENAFQSFVSHQDSAERNKLNDRQAQRQAVTSSDIPNYTSDTHKVPVNEDFLFDVDIEHRELGPAYWLGPVYDVRRGSWFHADGTPCDENLATQLEEGYLRLAPWKFAKAQAQTLRARPKSTHGAPDAKDVVGNRHGKSWSISSQSSTPDLRGDASIATASNSEKGPESTLNNTHRLFGPHSHSMVTYQDSVTAWLTTDDFISRMSGSMYQRFAGGSHLSGVKLTRGFVDPAKKSDNKQVKEDAPSATTGSQTDKATAEHDPSQTSEKAPEQPETTIESLERHMTALVNPASKGSDKDHDEEVRKRDEIEIRDDYANKDNEEQNRPIDHLLLVTHGIGQRLGLRLETVNFIHDVNTLRKSLKAVYGQSADLQALNSELDAVPKNCRIQVLPINWRHRLDFPKQSLKHNRGEHDLGDASAQEDEYPSLDDLTVDGVPAVRNLITDLALDILLYDSPAYKDHIARIVIEECNRIYHLFCQREPSFDGKVGFIGHSLGSAIMFDILCRQGDASHGQTQRTKQYKLDFEVEDFYAIGSPIGLFQMLKGRTIAARPPASSKSAKDSAASHSDIPVSSPKCSQIFNIFHPADPISYRIEPLISPAMAALKPQLLPYTKRGLFGVPTQGLSNIGNRVGQSVSGLWSSLSTGIASSLLNRSLGLTTDDEVKLRDTVASRSLSLGAGTNLGAGTLDADGARTTSANGGVNSDAAKVAMADATDMTDQPKTLTESNIETLYAGFQQRRKSDEHQSNSRADWEVADEKAKKLKREEAKVRALNSNGRVDYSIQE